MIHLVVRPAGRKEKPADAGRGLCRRGSRKADYLGLDAAMKIACARLTGLVTLMSANNRLREPGIMHNSIRLFDIIGTHLGNV